MFNTIIKSISICIVEISFIDGANRSTRRNLPTGPNNKDKSITDFEIYN
jgi:hypothetical protein